MSAYSIKDIVNSTDRYKLFTLMCVPDNLFDSITFLKAEGINALNIGKELALYIDSLEDFRYLNMDVCDFTLKLLNTNKAKINREGNNVVAIYNLGILLEPQLEISVAKLLKEFSKTVSLIIIWENQIESPARLTWGTQANNYSLDFFETQIKKLNYEI
jgi:hypothetical protein